MIDYVLDCYRECGDIDSLTRVEPWLLRWNLSAALVIFCGSLASASAYNNVSLSIFSFVASHS